MTELERNKNETRDRIALKLYNASVEKRQIRIRTPCTAVEQKQLLIYGAYSRDAIIFTPDSFSPRAHGLAAALQELAVHLMVKTKEHFPNVCHIGASPPEAMRSRKEGDHFCNLVEDGRDEARMRARLCNVSRSVAAAKTDDRKGRQAFLELFEQALIHGKSSPLVCANGFGECDVVNDIGIAVNSLHNVSPANVLAAMEKKNMTALWSVMWLPDEFAVEDEFYSENAGYYFRPHSSSETRKRQHFRTLLGDKPFTVDETIESLRFYRRDEFTEFGFYNHLGIDTSEPYIHNTRIVKEWMHIACVYGRRYNLHIEINMDLGPCKILKCSRVVHALRTARILRTGYENHSKVVRLRALHQAGWNPNKLRPKDYVLAPTQNVEALYTYLVSQDTPTVNLATLFARARQSQIVMGDQELRGAWRPPAEDFDDVVVTIYIAAQMTLVKREQFLEKCHKVLVQKSCWQRVLAVYHSYFPGFKALTKDYLEHYDLFKRTSDFVVKIGQIRAREYTIPWTAPVYKPLDDKEELLALLPPVPAATIDTTLLPRRIVDEYMLSIVDNQTDEALTTAFMRLAADVAAREAGDVDLSSILFVDGPPGTGKTHYAVNELCNGRTIVLVPTRALAAEWTGLRVPGVTVMTYLAGLAALRSGANWDSVIIDEISLFSIGYVGAVRLLQPHARFAIIGDLKQIGFIDWSHTMIGADEHKICYYRNRFRLHELTINYRNPPGTVEAVNALFGYKMTANTKEETPWLEVPDEKSAVELFSRATLICFGQNEKLRLTEEYPGREVMTAQESQGATRDDVILFVDDASFPLRAAQHEQGHLIVAFTRHRKQLVVIKAERETLRKLALDYPAAYAVLEATHEESPYLTMQLPPVDPKPVLFTHDATPLAPIVVPISPAEADIILAARFKNDVTDEKPFQVFTGSVPPSLLPVRVDTRCLTTDDVKAKNPLTGHRRWCNTHQWGKCTNGSPFSTLMTIAGRFGRKITLVPNTKAVENEAVSMVKKTLDQFFKPEMVFNEDDFHRALEECVIVGKQKGSIDKIKPLEEFISMMRLNGFEKAQLKVKAGVDLPAHTFKAGQSIINLDPNMNMVMGPLARFLSKMVVDNLKDNVKLYDGCELSEATQHLIPALRAGHNFGGTDITEQDASFNALHNLVKRKLLQRLLAVLGERAGRLIQLEHDRMVVWKVFVRDVVAMVCEFMNHSGNSFTLICNSLMSLSLLPNVVKLSADFQLVFVGDDTLFTATRIEWLVDGMERMFRKWNTRVKKENMIVPTFCKHFVTRDGLLPDLVKEATQVISKTFKNETLFMDYKASLVEARAVWHNEERFDRATYYASLAHGITPEAVRCLAGVNLYVDDCTWADFLTNSVAPAEPIIIEHSKQSMDDSYVAIAKTPEIAKLLKHNTLIEKVRLAPRHDSTHYNAERIHGTEPPRTGNRTALAGGAESIPAPTPAEFGFTGGSTSSVSIPRLADCLREGLLSRRRYAESLGADTPDNLSAIHAARPHWSSTHPLSSQDFAGGLS